MGKTILVNYAGAADPELDEKLLFAQSVLAESAKIGGIDAVISWNRRKLVETEFYSRNREVLDSPRGGGFWLWKPYIILEALRSAAPGDTVMYWDVGRVKPHRLTRPVASLVRWCQEHRGILPGVGILPQGQWTKRDCFHWMGCDSEKFWKATQIQGTFSVWSGRAAMEFVAEWLRWCQDRRCLTDDANLCGLENLAGFQQHRHDQSVLTNLCVKRQIQTPKPPSMPPGYWTKNVNIWSELLETRSSRGEHDRESDWIVKEERTWRIILAHEPEQPFAMHRLGLACLRTNRIAQGIELLTKAADALPQVCDVQRDAGSALEKLGRDQQALRNLSRAAANPQLREPSALFAQMGDLAGRTEDGVRAEVSYRQALIADLECVPAWLGLAELLLGLARHKEAIEALRRARLLRPNDSQLHSNLLRAIHSSGRYQADQINHEHGAWADHHGRMASSRGRSYTNDPSGDRTLRIGYVASDFGRRAVAAFAEPLLSQHQRGAGEVEIYCYSASPIAPGKQRQRDTSRQLNAGDEEAAAQILSDRIDILVDLTGHGARNRLPLLLRRPAPVQIAWLGYPRAHLPAAIDWRLTDMHLDPPSEDESAGRLLRLPRTFACYGEPELLPGRVPSPAAKTQMITFGYLGDPVDVTTDAIGLWCRILAAVPDSRLLLRCDFDSPVIAESAEEHGVNPSRIETVRKFGGPLPYLEAFQWVDIALDTFPRSGHLTSCDALWMGVPLITLRGNRADSRMGADLLANLDMSCFVATSMEEYQARAVELAGDRTRLAELRQTLPDRMRQSPLMDAEDFARQVEKLYRQAWEHWCAGRQNQTPRPAEAMSL